MATIKFHFESYSFIKIQKENFQKKEILIYYKIEKGLAKNDLNMINNFGVKNDGHILVIKTNTFNCCFIHCVCL